MKRLTRSFAWLSATALALLLVAPSLAQAQRAWSFQARLGVAIPAGDLGDFQDPGPSFGGGVAYWLQPRLAIRADIDVDLLSGADLEVNGTTVGEAPDLQLIHYNAGIEYDLLPPGQSLWRVHLNGGLGATSITNGDSETDLSINGGGKVGYEVNPTVSVFGGVQAYIIFADDTWISIPIQAGVRVLLPR